MVSALFSRIAERARLALTSDRAFLERAYREILAREADQDGLDYYLRLLRQGHSRTAVLVGLVRSDEFLSKLPRADRPSLQTLSALRPDQYHEDEDLSNGTRVPVFEAGGAADFDWLESMLVESRYYERPGVWNLQIDTDKRVMAEMLAAFAPARGLELGCASGAVLSCLADLGFTCEGVEISALALQKASPEVRGRIHRGDLLELKLEGPYDLVFGLDVFEHLNPNKLGAYLAEIDRLLRAGGYLFGNIPAFGTDPVFGGVFPFYLRGWDGDAANGRHFSKLHVDAGGYPLHGHLIWADWAWWVRRFEEHGLQREVEIERALHGKYDAYMDKRSRARKSYFVFSKGGSESRRAIVLRDLRDAASQALQGREV